MSIYAYLIISVYHMTVEESKIEWFWTHFCFTFPFRQPNRGSKLRVVLLDPNDRNHGPQLNTWDALCINRGVEDCPIPRLSSKPVKDLWEEYISKKHDPYFTMIKLFSGGGVFAKKYPELLLLNDDDEKETGRTNLWTSSPPIW